MSQFERPPIPANDWRRWAERLTDYLQRTKTRLAFYSASDSAASAGELIYNREGYLMVSDGNGFRKVPIFVDPPTVQSDSGYPGQMAYDSNYLYVCTDLDTWRKTPHSTW